MLFPIGFVLSQFMAGGLRFAIDWVRLGQNGETWRGASYSNKNHYAYGAEVLAVASGVIASVRDGIPENIPFGPAGTRLTFETVGGNEVVLKLSDEVYAIYAHLQPGSIRVKPGESVHRGHVLGLVGNSGLSFEPHLHFQISDGSLLLGAEGIPYIFESFEVLGHGREWKKGKTVPEIHKMQMPLKDEVVRFPASAE